jgi:hypothetical protein
VDIGRTVTGKVLKSHFGLLPRCPPYQPPLMPDLDIGHSRIGPNLPHVVCSYLSQFMGENTLVFTEGMFRLPYLTTLSTYFGGRLGKLHIESWRAPSLRHLEIIGLTMADLQPASLEPIFSLSGQLRTLAVCPSPLPLSGV